MKKIWGLILCGALILGLCAGGFLGFMYTGSGKAVTASANVNAYAVADEPNDELVVSYSDNYNIETSEEIPLGMEGDYPKRVTFNGAYDDDDGFGDFAAIVGVTATFEIQIPAGHEHGKSFNEALLPWIEVDMSDPLEDSMASPDFGDDALGFDPSEVVVGEGLYSISFRYGAIGIYRVRIYTLVLNEMTLEWDPYINTYIFIVKNTVEPDMYAFSFVQATAVDKFYNTINQINIGVQKDQYSTHIPIAFASPSTVKITNQKGEEVNYFTIAYGEGTAGSTLVLTKQVKKIKNGKYILSTVMAYSVEKIDSDGVLHDPSLEVVNVSVEMSFESRPIGNTWWYTLLGVLILGALGGGWWALNWMIKHSQLQHSQRMDVMREKRAETERQNIERLRTEIAGQE